MAIILGFTGTRYGMSDRQKAEIRAYLEQHQADISLVVHGDCIGADAEFDAMCDELKMVRMIRPGFSTKDPTDTSTRAYCKVELTCEPKGNFARNRDIVNGCDRLLATPFDDKQVGGTWYTIKYAQKLGKDVIVFER